MPRPGTVRTSLLREIRSLKGRVRLKIRRTRKDLHWKWCRLGLQTRSFLLRGRPVSVQVNSGCLHMVPRGATAAQVWGGMIERAELQFILDALRPDMTLFDVGANAGLFAIAAAMKMAHVRVYAFEPYSWAYQLLEQNLRLNGIDNVTAVRAALAGHVGEAVLQLNAAGRDELNTIGRATHPDCRVVAQERVPVTTVDAFIEAQGIARVDVMKVDVQGAELPVFRGARKLLERNDAPLILYTGYSSNTRGFGYHPVETMWRLGDCGYSLFVLDCETGEVALRPPGPEYDAVVVAAKPGHPAYRKLAEGSR